MRRAPGMRAAVAVAVVAAAPAARADPQWNLGVVTGVCGTGTRAGWWQETCWWNGARGDLILGRARSRDLGVGPHLAVETAAFDDLRLGGGATGVIPLGGSLPLVLSAGGYARRADGDWEPGLATSLMIGSRSYNFHGSYGIAAGLLLGTAVGLGESRERTLFVAAQIDAMFLALPGIAAYEWVRGEPADHQ